MGEVTAVTLVGMRSTLAHFDAVHGLRPVDKLGPATVERWFATRRGMKPATQSTQWSHVTVFLDWMVKRGHLRVNPCREMRAPRRPRVEPLTIEPGDIRALLRAAPDARARSIIMLEWGMGARRIEVHRANVEHWQQRSGNMLLIGKGGHERTVAVPDYAARAFDAYLRQHPASTGPLFRSYTRPGVRLSTSTIGHYVAEWMLAAGVKKAPGDGRSGHSLRRTCASELLDETGDLRVVQEVLGHADLSSGAPYLRRMARGRMRDAMEARGIAPVLTGQERFPW